MTEVWDKFKHRLSGSWCAVSYHMYSSDAPSADIIAKPHGDTPLGRAIITPGGYLSAHLANPDKISKPLPGGMPWQTAPDSEVAWVARGMSMYCGYLKLYQEEGKEGDEGLWWETKVEVCSDPNRFGALEKRKVRFVRMENGEEGMELKPFQDLVMEVRCLPFTCSPGLGLCADRSAGWEESERCFDVGEV